MNTAKTLSLYSYMRDEGPRALLKLGNLGPEGVPERDRRGTIPAIGILDLPAVRGARKVARRSGRG